MPLKFVFWLLVFGVFYTYVFYGFILYFFTKTRKNIDAFSADKGLRVVHIIAAYNESEVIGQKIINALSLDYTEGKLQTVIVADGSTDHTTEIVKQYPEVVLLYEPIRKGKLAAINRAVALFPETDILVFSDANTMLNEHAILKMVKHYADPAVGGVAGAKKVQIDQNGVLRGEGFYWNYESMLKKLESGFHTVVGAAGELFSVRKDLFRPLPEDIILDDLMISLDLCRKGYVVRYEPDAFAVEGPSLSMTDEKIRRIRISAGAFQALCLTTDLMNPFRFGKFSFQYWSHRIMRWVFCPVAIPLIFLFNGLIMMQDPGSFYPVLFYLQCFFYVLALIGWVLASLHKPVGNFFYIPFYALFMQAAQWKGLAARISGSQSALWKKAKRKYTHLNGL